MLTVDQIQVYYGAIHALKSISFHLEQGEIVALVGANGAGKSTTLKTISGLLRPHSGRLTFKELDLANTAPQEIVQRGVVHIPEGRKIFARMTVWENLVLGAFTQTDRAQIQRDLEAMFTRFPRLADRRSQLGGTLSGGEQQMLAIARGLMAHPTLLLLDEPSMGLAPKMVETIFDIISEINEQGVSILLVEQNAQIALAVSHRAYVLETGKVMMEGVADDLLENPQVLEAYLGSKK